MEELKEFAHQLEEHLGFNEDDFEGEWPRPKDEQDDDIPYIYNEELHNLATQLVENQTDQLTLMFGSSDPSQYMITHLDAMWYVAHTLFVNSSVKTIRICYGGEVFSKHEKLAFFIANAISKHPSVETLDLSFNGFTPDTAYYLGRALLRNNTIKHLNVSGNNFTDKTASAFINALTLHRSLETLNLSDCNLGRSSAIALAKLFRGIPALREVILDGNKFDGPAGLSFLMQGLQNVSLDYFSLSNCGLDDSVGLLLAEGLRSSHIKAFCVSSNRLSDVTGVGLVRSLARSSVQIFVLDNNKFGKATALELESLLSRDSTRLTRLSFMENNLSVQEMTYFANAFARNGYLKELYIGADGFVPHFTLASDKVHEIVVEPAVKPKMPIGNNNLNNFLHSKIPMTPESERELAEVEPLIFNNNSPRPRTEEAPLLSNN
eukprot:TRINITY_DN1006_c0_g1_i1.p1 TRINITY_DN1006_c0_g1~~TRINITY_DN1006_c0_g1_i1.p1  ORF type:complete len:450 (-),score=148.05 TRINITY_DN1006_c0_g1_i1:137-1438(-)